MHLIKGSGYGYRPQNPDEELRLNNQLKEYGKGRRYTNVRSRE